MSALGVEFLEEWLDLDVGVPNQGGYLNKAHALAAKLAADATAAGISVKEMDLRPGREFHRQGIWQSEC
jgi:hypothetical protein